MSKIIKNNKGVSLVALVVTIIILIILAGISINMTLGEGGIITIAKRAKENIELAQIEEQTKLNELYAQLERNEGITGGEIDYDIIEKLNNFKKQIADYIEEAGGIKPDYTADAETFGERIKEIVKEVTKNATAIEEDILEGKTAWVNGKEITGTALKNKSISEMQCTVLTEFFPIGGNSITKNITITKDCIIVANWGWSASSGTSAGCVIKCGGSYLINTTNATNGGYISNGSIYTTEGSVLECTVTSPRSGMSYCRILMIS